MTLSGHLFLIIAAALPKIIPKESAKAMAVSPSLADIGKDSAIISLISLPFFSDTPKSPFRRDFM